MKRLIVYHPGYNIRIPGASLVHPFDGAKFAKAYAMIQREVPDAGVRTLSPEGPISDEALECFLTAEYRDALNNKHTIVSALEVRALRLLPMWLVQRWLLKPMRYAAAGTVLAAHQAVQGAVVWNLSGGYHHAAPDRGEGFCLLNDVGLAVQDLRRSGLLGMDDRCGIIDLDAHHGNGNARCFLNDEKIRILDAYEDGLCSRDPETRSRVDIALPFDHGTSGTRYLATLAPALEDFFARGPMRLVFYNAGTDPYQGDRLANFTLSEDDLVRRDQTVLTAAERAGVPVVVMTSGGYSADSWHIIGRSVSAWLQA
ncbi:MAG: histone deacetylase [Planctomycetota bacterium]|jgi:histone deacetylase 11|nr:histone deacetylase [Planctomycetota bacterium]